MQLNEKLEALTESLKEYADTNYELIKLEVIDHSSDIIAGIISTFVVGIMLVLFLFFGSMYAAYYLSDLLGINYVGFAIVSGFYLFIGLLFYLSKKGLIEKRAVNNFVKRKMTKN